MKATQQLHDLGQSLWLDNITRALLTSGTLGRYIGELSVTGLTSNPTIFDQAIGNADFYDAAIGQKAHAGKSGEPLFFELALEDLTQAADLFRPIHDATGGIDGWVSLEVSPLLADDTAGTLRAAVQLHARAQRANLFIKIPGNRAGLPAIEESIFAGVPVNVTLLFSREHYLAAAEAYMRGIERRIDAGLDPAVGCVASLFISRWDVAIKDKVPDALHNRLGIAIALRTYKAYRELLASKRWQTLAGAGARPQRLLWASTGTKDPAAPDTLYIEALAAPDTINTMPEKTLLAFAEHGQIEGAMTADGGDAEATLAEFAQAGVDDVALAAQLQRDGAQSFAKSWNELMQRIASKSAALTHGRTGGSHILTAELDQQCIDTLRFLSVDMVQRANSGHPGLPLGAAPMAYVLWTRWLKHNPRNPHWLNRDRFVLSAGHGSALLYSLLHLTGYDLSLEDIRQFRQWGSKAPGHPERGHAPGVETTTGPLGQGFGNAVGMAIAEAQLAARYNRAGHALIDHHTYVLVGDGDLMEGVTAEAASLAGNLKLGKLTCLYDDNHVSLAAATDITFSENRAQRFAAYGWHTVSVADGNDVAEIDAALAAARAESARPSLILVRTHIGYGSPEQDSFKAHGSPLGVDDVRKTKQALGWPAEPDFLIPETALAHFRAAVERGALAETAWNSALSVYARTFPDLAEELQGRLRAELPPGWDVDIPVFDADDKGLATRDASGQVMNAVASRLPALTGGSADLDPSTKTALKGLGDFNPPPAKNTDEQGADSGGWSYAGRNLHFGVREHAMGAIVNGLAAHGGFIPYGATFLIFSDYLRPSIRLAALMGLHVVHVFTHDSLAVGEDGPTHQPVEQLASLRAIPNLVVIRPADANETVVAWRVALETRERPVMLVLTRQDVPTLDRNRYAAAEGLRRGAYILRDAPNGQPDLILLASGSEVSLIVAAAQRLQQQGIAVRCVSMPSWELFEALPQAEREAVLPPSVSARLAVELGVAQGWERYIGARGDMLGVQRFGASAPAGILLTEYGFTVDNVCARAKALLTG